MESELLFEQLLNNQNDTEAAERILVKLIHVSFKDENTTVSYLVPEGVRYRSAWVDAGGFTVDGYTIQRNNPGSFRVCLSASYDDMVFQQTEEGEELVQGKVVYQLELTVGRHFHSGKCKVIAMPDV